MAAKKATAFTWMRNVVFTEGAPLVVADPIVYRTRTGDEGDGPSDFVEVVATDAGKLILLDTDGGGGVDVGWSDRELVVVLAPSDFEDAKAFAKLAKRIEGAKKAEYLAGDLEVTSGLVVADSALSGAVLPDALPTTAGAVAKTGPWFLPRAAGRYTVVEGHFEDELVTWCRLVPYGTATYLPRPKEDPVDPVQRVLDRISFADAVREARALEDALELVSLGRPDLALDVCAKASPARAALASWTRILALTAMKDRAAQSEARTLASKWLAPADSASSANQVLPRKQLERALEAAAALGPDPALDALRTKIAAAPEPEVFVAGGDDFF